MGTMPQTYDLLPKPTMGAGGSHPDVKEFTIEKATWNKKNVGVLGLTVMLKHVDSLSAAITRFTQSDQEGDLCIWEDLLFKNPVQRF